MEENNYTEINETTAPHTPLIIGEDIKAFLAETVKWGKFLAIVGFVFTALIAVIGLGIMVFGAAITSKLPAGGNIMGGFIGFIYLLMGLLYYFPSKYLYDFATYIKQALVLNDQESLSYGFLRLKSLFRFWGILMIFLIILYALMLVFFIGMAIFAGSLAGGQGI